jgi:head-tail adaptor
VADSSVEKAKADAKKATSDIGKKVAYAKADVNAGVEKIKANFEDDKAEKDRAYAKADIKADAKKAKADIENKMAHAKADAEKAKADIKGKVDDALK